MKYDVEFKLKVIEFYQKENYGIKYVDNLFLINYIKYLSNCITKCKKQT